VVAILAVTVLAVIIGRRQMDVMSDVNVLEIGSYGIIFCIGAYMTWCALRGREAFGHDHGPAASTFDEPAVAAAARADHHEHDHDHHHGHGHQHDHHHHEHHHDDGTRARTTWLARAARATFGRYGEILAVGVVSGVRPCSGSILVLLFALANGVFLLGVAAALMIALGVAITISALGIGTIVLRRAVAGGDAPATPWQAFAGRALAIAGSVAVMLMGGLLFGGALQTYGVI
jgi:ABC-type nickel/cobalt efflux system permease component RcnA